MSNDIQLGPFPTPADPDHILRLQCLAAAGDQGDIHQQLNRAKIIYKFVTNTEDDD